MPTFTRREWNSRIPVHPAANVFIEWYYACILFNGCPWIGEVTITPWGLGGYDVLVTRDPVLPRPRGNDRTPAELLRQVAPSVSFTVEARLAPIPKASAEVVRRTSWAWILDEPVG